ncbi:hypothetical protein [Laedolimicola ammoniilytica]|uniref:Gram-positive cocci surface proteins LPxTG domain-containing protein n=1 Tax=Laedolimicola ammoniilytica TaxID=2981771 RepID=A0ABT2RV62_9FIRM|nr:hypothetical protein [Laedolimicola ammoniilytica]MCU6696057.1 hypothetical protein [Laedolimicola ammoniilytica]SCH42916.1 Uncharacterised protein [uncultured Clostridium sp.]
MKSKWMKCCAVLMGVLLATSPLTALAEETQEPTATAVESKMGVGEAGNEQKPVENVGLNEEEYEYPTFTVRGKNYTLNSDTWAEGSVITLYMYKSEFKNCNTPEDYASILEQFLGFVKERAERGDNIEHYCLECNQGEDVIASLKIPVTDASYKIIKELRDIYHIDFQLLACVKRSDGDDMWTATSNITEPTTLGFEVYDCLENTNIYFYGKGYQINIDDVPYTQGGDPILVYAESGKQIASAKDGTMRYSVEGKYVDLPIEVKDAGLYYVMPEASLNDTSKANVVLKSNGDTDKVATVISSAVATAGDKADVKIEIAQSTDESGKVVNPQIGKAVFEQLNNKKAADAAVIFSYGDLSYKFAAADITNPGAVESITLGADEATSEVKAKVGDNVAYAIDFAHSGKLPGKATVTIPVDLADGQYTWCYVNDANQLTEGKLVTVKNKTVEVPLEHCSTYALVAGDVTGTTNGNTDNGNSGNTNSGNTNNGNTNNGSTDSSNDTGNTSSGSSSGSHGNSKITRVDDNSPAVNSVKEVTGTEVLSHTTYWALSDYYRDLLVKQIDKAKAPGEVLWFYDITVDEVTFPLTFTVNVKGLNGRKDTVVHFLDDETPEYITPTVKGDQVTFTLNSLSPVAIVADGTKAAALTSPKTGDSTDFTAPLALLLLAAAGLTGCAVYSRRKKQA